MKRPSIKTPCIADRYHGPDERYAEITFPDGRGLLLRATNDGRVTLYRADTIMTANVRSPHGHEAFETESIMVCLAPKAPAP